MPKIKNQLRENVVKVRYNDDELAKVMAAKKQPHLASWIRDKSLNESMNVKIVTIEPSLIGAIGKIGNNINQIARAVNLDKKLENHFINEKTIIALNESNRLLGELIETIKKHGEVIENAS